MIRLKSLLFEAKSKPNTLRVLVVGDEYSKPKFSFMNRLLRLDSVSGDKFIDSGANSESMMNIVRSKINDGYNAVVIFCSGRNENETLLNIIENFKLMIDAAHKADVKCIVCTIPSFDYIKNKKDQVSEKFTKKIETINNWLENSSNADDVIDVNFMTDKRDYFDRSGNDLTQEANSKIFKTVITTLSDLMPSKAVDTPNSTSATVTVDGKKYDVDDIQQKLSKNGIRVTKDEIRAGEVDDKIIKLKLASDVVATKEPEDTEVKISDGERATADEIIDYLKSKGLSAAGAAGVAANLYVESAGTFSTTIKGDHGTSIGLAQWHKDRWTGKNGLVAWSKQNGKDPYSVEGQLDFLMWELSKPSFKSLLEVLKTTEDPEEAAELFCKKFERPAFNQATYNKRKKYAREFSDSKTGEEKTEPESGEETSSWGSLTKLAGDILSPKTVGATAIATYGFSNGEVDSGKVTAGGDGGDWGGSMPKALEVAKVAKDFAGKDIVSSQKRSRKSTASGNTSDHWSGNLDSYAVDLATGSATEENLAKGDALLAHIMNWLGHPEYTGGKWFNFNKDGYRYQIGWRVKDHYDHIHVGVKKL